jgi:transposase-like protein
MIDFPIDELLDDNICTLWLERHLHPDGLIGPHCGHPERRLFRAQGHFPAYRCRTCQGSYTLLTGTVFAKTRQRPATLVLLRRGIAKGESTARLARELGVSRKQLHTLRQRIQAKGGGTGRKDIATLKGDMDREEAPMGVLITLNEPTAEMKREAALAGEYHYSDVTAFPTIQILSVKDWFEGRTVKLPTDTVNPFRQAAMKADQESLF